MRTRRRLKPQSIGYKSPPKHSQFKPGQSGNPSGRPKGTLNLKTDLEEELKTKIVIRENGRTLRLSRQRAAVKVFVDKVLKGDVRALTLFLKNREAQMPQEAEEAAFEVSDARDEAILKQALKRMQGQLEAPRKRKKGGKV